MQENIFLGQHVFVFTLVLPKPMFLQAFNITIIFLNLYPTFLC